MNPLPQMRIRQSSTPTFRVGILNKFWQKKLFMWNLVRNFMHLFYNRLSYPRIKSKSGITSNSTVRHQSFVVNFSEFASGSFSHCSLSHLYYQKEMVHVK